MLTINRSLFLAYFIIGNGLVPRLLPTKTVTTVVLSTLWLGFVLAISGMEAWLKFQAPFCPRPFALDIGRTIFPALNAVEMGLCLSIWLQRPSPYWAINTACAYYLGFSTLILLVEVLFLTPKLVRRGKQVVYQHVKTHGGAKVDTDNSPIFAALERDFQGQTFEKTDRWHIVYVVLEFIKMIGLTCLIAGQQGAAL